MNYKEKVAQQIHEFIAEVEENLKKLVTDLTVESFKNGVDTGRNRKNRPSTAEKASKVEEGESHETN